MKLKQILVVPLEDYAFRLVINHEGGQSCLTSRNDSTVDELANKLRWLADSLQLPQEPSDDRPE